MFPIDKTQLYRHGKAVLSCLLLGIDGCRPDIVARDCTDELQIPVNIHLLQFCQLDEFVSQCLSQVVAERRVDFQGLVFKIVDCHGFHIRLDGGSRKRIYTAR